MPQSLQMVGAGDIFCFVGQSLQALIDAGIAITVTDIREELLQRLNGAAYVRRWPPTQSLADILSADTVYLAHPNPLHIPDAEDLLAHTGANVMMEKPYAINIQQLEVLKALMAAYPTRLNLVEFFSSSLASPLLRLAGLIEPGSFYEREGMFVGTQGLQGKLLDYTGDITAVEGRLIEGGASGTLKQRDASLIDPRLGGGMIQDLTHHTLGAFYLMTSLLGDILPESIQAKVAFCKEYLEYCRARSLDPDAVGESYCELRAMTSLGIPVNAYMGKYLDAGKTIFDFTISGKKGTVVMDARERRLTHNGEVLLELDPGVPDYYPTFRYALEGFDAGSGFASSGPLIKLQEMIFTTQKVAQGSEKLYSQGTPYTDVIGSW